MVGDNIFYVKKGKSKDNITTPFWSEEKLNRPILLYVLSVTINPNQTHLFYHCSRSKQFWIEFEAGALFRIDEFVSA